VRDALGARAVTVVLAGVGGALGRGAFELLGPGGRQIAYGWQPGSPLYPADGELASRGVSSEPLRGPLDRPGGLRPLETAALAAAAEGRLLPAVQPFPLAEAAAAHTALENRMTLGKVVLVP